MYLRRERERFIIKKSKNVYRESFTTLTNHSEIRECIRENSKMCKRGRVSQEDDSVQPFRKIFMREKYPIKNSKLQDVNIQK